MKKTKIAAFLLSLVLILQCCVVPVYATEEETTLPEDETVSISG